MVRSQVMRGRSSANSSEGYLPESRSSTFSKRGAGEGGEGRGATDEGVEVVDGDDGFARRLAFASRNGKRGRMRDGGDDLLGEDVEGIAEDGGGFDEALVHGAGDGGAGDEVGAVLGEDDAFARRLRPCDRRGRCAACRWRRRAATRSG